MWAGAYHSRLMHSAMVKLAEELKNVSFGTPSMPVYCNYEARVVEGPDDIRNVLEHQVCGSVRWTASMQKLVDQGHRLFLETGTGQDAGRHDGPHLQGCHRHLHRRRAQPGSRRCGIK